MRRGQRVRLSMRLNGQTQVLEGKVSTIDGKQAWVLWADGRTTRVFVNSLEPVIPSQTP